MPASRQVGSEVACRSFDDLVPASTSGRRRAGRRLQRRDVDLPVCFFIHVVGLGGGQVLVRVWSTVTIAPGITVTADEW
jgi:hypothetical protein